MSENKPPNKFGENLVPEPAMVQGDRNDPFAKEYLDWVNLQRRKAELAAKLGMTANVPDKYRDPEYVEAKKQYTGSIPDVARRIVEARSAPGNVLKASLKTPDDPDRSRVDQMADALKAFTGSPEKAFRENRVMGEDLLADTDLSPEDKKNLGIAIDIAADLLGTAGVTMGAKLAAKAVGNTVAKAAYGAKAVAGKAGALAEKVLPASKAKIPFGSTEFAPVASTAEDVAARAALYNTGAQDARFAIRSNPAAEVPEIMPSVAQAVSHEAEVIPKAANALDNLDMPEIAEAVVAKAPPVVVMPKAIVPAKEVVEDATKRFSMKELQKLEKEEASRQSEALFRKLSGATEEVPSVESRASDILNQRMSGASPDVGLPMPQAQAKYYGPEAPAITRVLTPNEPLTAQKLVQGLETFGNKAAPVLRSQKEIDKELEAVLKAANKKKKK